MISSRTASRTLTPYVLMVRPPVSIPFKFQSRLTAEAESAVGTGDVCGATFLNYRFEDLVKTRLGKTSFDLMIKNKPKTWQTALHTFEEHVKRRFNTATRREFNIPMPGLADNPNVSLHLSEDVTLLIRVSKAGVDSGFMTLSVDHVRNIFDPVVSEVIKLVEGQVDAVREKGEAVSAILLGICIGQIAASKLTQPSWWLRPIRIPLSTHSEALHV